MKNTLFLLASFAIVILQSVANGQTISASYDGVEIVLSKDTLAKFTQLSGKYIEGKTYVKWNVVDEKEDGYYYVYKSADGIKYDVIGEKQGVGVPIPSPISYSFQDNSPNEGISWYMIAHIGMNNTYITSKTIKVMRPYSFQAMVDKFIDR